MYILDNVGIIIIIAAAGQLDDCILWDTILHSPPKNIYVLSILTNILHQDWFNIVKCYESVIVTKILDQPCIPAATSTLSCSIVAPLLQVQKIPHHIGNEYHLNLHVTLL